MKVVNALVEGDMDEAAVKRIIEAAGHLPGTVYGKRGYGYIREKIGGFNLASQGAHYIALVDFMDTRLSCPPEVISNWLSNRLPNMLFRVVVRELESWLLADRQNLAKFLHIDVAKVPVSPELVHDPKQALVNLARRSRSKRVREALVPQVGSTATVGKLYKSEMISFIQEHWNIVTARGNAPSLDRCLMELERLN